MSPYTQEMKPQKLPFSKTLDASKKSDPVSVRLFFGGPEAWARAKADHSAGFPALVIPVDEPLTLFRWGTLAGFSVLAIETRETSPHYRLTLARLLAAGGVRDCYVLPANFKAIDSIYWRGAQ